MKAERTMNDHLDELAKAVDYVANTASDTFDVTVMEIALGEARSLQAEVERLREALTWTQTNFRSAVQGKPVRDMAENLAFNEAVLGGP